MKHKVGDVVRLVQDDYGHQFPLGCYVVICKVDNDGDEAWYGAFHGGLGRVQWFTDGECEVAFPVDEANKTE